MGRIPVTRGADFHRADHLGMLYRLVLDGILLVWQVGNHHATSRSSTRDWLLQADGTWSVLFQDRRRVPFVHEALKPVLRGGLKP